MTKPTAGTCTLIDVLFRDQALVICYMVETVSGSYVETEVFKGDEVEAELARNKDAANLLTMKTEAVLTGAPCPVAPRANFMLEKARVSKRRINKF